MWGDAPGAKGPLKQIGPTKKVKARSRPARGKGKAPGPPPPPKSSFAGFPDPVGDLKRPAPKKASKPPVKKRPAKPAAPSRPMVLAPKATADDWRKFPEPTKKFRESLPKGRYERIMADRSDEKSEKGRGLLATAINSAAKVVPGLSAAVAADTVTSGRVGRATKNLPKDAAELVVTTPTSVAKLGDTAIHDPKKVPGMLIEPYKELAKDPVGFTEKHPLSATLMVAPAVRMPGRVAGKAARTAGKQTLERAPKTLPGTALKEQRSKSKDAIVNAIQTRRDRGATSAAVPLRAPRNRAEAIEQKVRKRIAGDASPTMSDKDIQRRVDEFFDFATQKRAQQQASAATEGKKRFADLPKAERKQKIAEHVEGARKGSKKTVDKRFAEEFGSTWFVDPKTKAIIKPKDAQKGVLHASRGDAQRVVDALNKRSPTEFMVRPVGKGEFAVIPKVAKERMYGSATRYGAQGHQSVGTSPATGARVMRASRKALTNTVLPTSPRWLLGQAAEAGLRSAAAGAGPLDLLRVNRVVKVMNKAQKGSGDEFLMRISGGQFGLTGTAREFAVGKRTLAEEFANTGLEGPARVASAVGRTPPARAVKAGWNRYTRTVMDSINGAIENTARKAMAGQALKDSTLMEKHVLKLSDDAIDDAARGLTGTENQVALARSVDRMYGQYQKFSPGRRSALLHWTPFLPWYINAAQFVLRVLPADHPMHTATLASLNVALEDWRKENKMSLRGEDHKPIWMLGGYPTKDGVIPIGKITPSAAFNDPLGGIAALPLPGLATPVKNAWGIDYKGDQLKHPGFKGHEFNAGEKALRAATSAVEAHVPLAGLAGRISGVVPKYVDHKAGVPSPREAVERWANPVAPIKNTGGKKKRAPKKAKKLSLGGSGGKLPLGGSGGKLPLN